MVRSGERWVTQRDKAVCFTEEQWCWGKEKPWFFALAGSSSGIKKKSRKERGIAERKALGATKCTRTLFVTATEGRGGPL